jgi:hypothetical protein
MEDIGERNGARIQQEADLGHLVALAALGQRRHVADADGAWPRRRGG